QGGRIGEIPIEAVAAVHLDGNILVVQVKGLDLYRPVVEIKIGLQTVQIDFLAVQKVQLTVQGAYERGRLGMHSGGQQFCQKISGDGRQVQAEIIPAEAGNVDVGVQFTLQGPGQG